MNHIITCTECEPPCILLPGDTAEYCVRGLSYDDVKARQEAAV
jgi:hypothetical protein